MSSIIYNNRELPGGFRQIDIFLPCDISELASRGEVHSMPTYIEDPTQFTEDQWKYWSREGHHLHLSLYKAIDGLYMTLAISNLSFRVLRYFLVLCKNNVKYLIYDISANKLLLS